MQPPQNQQIFVRVGLLEHSVKEYILLLNQSRDRQTLISKSVLYIRNNINGQINDEPHIIPNDWKLLVTLYPKSLYDWLQQRNMNEVIDELIYAKIPVNNINAKKKKNINKINKNKNNNNTRKRSKNSAGN